MTIEEKFTSVVKGRNSFTPTLVAYYEIPNGVIELSTVSSRQPNGITKSGFMEGVFGVTVVINNEMRSDKSNLLNNEREALEYIHSFNPTRKYYYVRSNCYGDLEPVTTDITHLKTQDDDNK